MVLDPRNTGQKIGWHFYALGWWEKARENLEGQKYNTQENKNNKPLCCHTHYSTVKVFSLHVPPFEDGGKNVGAANVAQGGLGGL